LHTAAGGQNTSHSGGQHTLCSNSDYNREESEATISSLILRSNQLLEENEHLCAENARNSDHQQTLAPAAFPSKIFKSPQTSFCKTLILDV